MKEFSSIPQSYIICSYIINLISSHSPFRSWTPRVSIGQSFFWTTLVHQSQSPYSYSDFIDLFVHLVMEMLAGSPSPRISLEIKRVLQLSKQTKVGDWYLYQNHTKIRIYGCMLAPYKLPRYLPMRLFAFEYYRQIINANEVKFFNAKKKANFKIKDQLGPFICNSREAGKEVDLILQRMKFQRIFVWRYDPLEVITKKR